jgi:hypothetical protein
MNWQNKYCENSCITGYNLQTQRNPKQNSQSIFHSNREKHSEIHMETQETLSSQSFPEKKE